MKKELTIAVTAASLTLLPLGGCVTTYSGYGGYTTGYSALFERGWGYEYFSVDSCCCREGRHKHGCHSRRIEEIKRRPQHHDKPQHVQKIEQYHPAPARPSRPQPIHQASRQFNNPTSSRRR